MLITHAGKSIRFSETEVKSSNRDTKGVKGITLKRGDYVIGVEALSAQESSSSKYQLLVITEKGLGKRTALDQYPVQKRSGVGVKVSTITKKTGNVASAKLVSSTKHKEIVISSREGQTIKLPLTKKSIPILGRATQGVILMRLKASDAVSAVALTYKNTDAESDDT